MIDTAESYAGGEAEIQMYALSIIYKHTHHELMFILCLFSGRVLRELNYRRSDLIITTKIFWGVRDGPNSGGLSRKQ